MRDHCPFCDRIWYENAKACAGVLVENEAGEVLLVRRNTEPFLGFWDVPGGFLEAEEAPEVGALREVHEEVGLAVELTSLLGIWMDRHEVGEDPTAWHHSLNLFYRAKVVGGQLKADPVEIQAMAWFSADALPPPEALAYTNGYQALMAWKAAPRFGVQDGKTSRGVAP